MAATTGYAAAVETNNEQWSYGIETAWGTKPAIAFQAIRFTSDTMAGAKTTQRPSEINQTRQASQSVTTQQTAGGTISYALSYGTFDEFMAMTLQSEWQAAQAINGVGGDIVLTASAGNVTITSTTTNKFTNISAGQWIRTLGFTNAANNNFWYVVTKNSATSLSVSGPNSATAVTETPSGTAAKVRASTVNNGTTFRSAFLQKSLASNLFLTYAGAYPTSFKLTGGLGSFFTGSIDIAAKSEAKVTSEQSTGAILAAPTGRVVDPVAGFVGVLWNDVALGTGIENFSLSLDNDGAASEFAMGSTAAQGILGGTFTASGTMRCYFKDATYYDIYQAETEGRLAFIVKDSVGAAYVFTFLAAKLNGRLVTGGPGQAAMMDFTIEGGPSGSDTFIIDRLAAT